MRALLISFVLVFCLGGLSAQPTPVHHWPMDSLPIVDVITGDTALIMFGTPQLTNGIDGNCVVLDSCVARIGQVINPNNARFTLSLWYKQAQNSPNESVFSQCVPDIFIGNQLGLSFTNSVVFNWSGIFSDIDHAGFIADQWNNFTLVVDTALGHIKMYQNGFPVLWPTQNYNEIYLTGPGSHIYDNLRYYHTYIGGHLYLDQLNPPNIDTLFSPAFSFIDNIYYFDDTLSQSQVQQLISTGCGWLPGLQLSPVVGLPAYGNLSCQNYGGSIAGTQWLYWPHDSLTFTPSTPPDTIINDTMFWHVNNIAPLGFNNILFTTYTDTNVAVGSQYPVAYGFYPDSACLGGGALTQTVYTDTITVLGSYDPNDKQLNRPDAPPSEWLTYTIRFQNTGTAPANRVIIRDTLSTELDFSTLQVSGASHDMYPVLDPTAHSVAFTFNPIYLPDSGADLAGSQGFVQYRVQVANGFAEADTIRNSASIYFDFNPPIVTNTTLTPFRTATSIGEPLIAPDFRLWPNPTGTVLNVCAAGATQLRVLDAQGRVVHSVAASSSTTVLDISALPVGVYTLLAETANGPVARRFVVAR
jgi:uncharacterized repeat protein (TIGR01451 family)